MESPQPAARSLFVGRDSEMSVLRTAVDEALAGSSRCVLLGGEPGAGKTRTAEEIATYALQRGAQVVWGRCYEGEGAPAFWPWVQIARVCSNALEPDRLDAVLGSGGGMLRHLVPQLHGSVPNAAVADVESAQARFWLFDAVCRLLVDTARRTPLVVIIDDLHGADQSSLLLLQFVVREMRDVPLMVLGAYRSVGPHTAPGLGETLAEVLRGPATEQLTLAGLSEEEVAQFIVNVAHAPAPHTLVAALRDRTEGNPLFVSEIVRMLMAEGRLGPGSDTAVGIVIPDTVRAVIGRRLAAVSPDAVDALGVAAVIGREVRGDVLEGALGKERASAMLSEGLDAAVLTEAPGRADGFRFAHALIRETLYDRISAAQRAQWHYQIAHVIERLPDREDQLAELAHHMFAAWPEGDPAKAVHYARAAADRAWALLAFEEAARLYELTLAALGRVGAVDEAQRCELLLALGDAQNIAKDRKRAQETFRLAASSARRLLAERRKEPAAPLLAHAALGFGGAWAGVNEVAHFNPSGTRLFDAEVVNLLEETLATLGENDSALRARVVSRLAVELYFIAPAARRAALIDEAVAAARRLDDPETLAFVLSLGHTAIWGARNVEQRVAMATEWIGAATQAGNRALAAAGYGIRVLDLLEVGEVERMELDAAAFARLAEETRQPFLLWAVGVQRAMRAMLDGRFEECERLMHAAREQGRHGRTSANLHFSLQLSALRLEQGRMEELEAMAAVLKAALERHPTMLTLRTQLALFYTVLGQHTAARSEFEYLATHDFADIAEDAVWLRSIAEAAEVCAALADAGRAETLYALLLPFAGHNVVGLGGTSCWGSAGRFLGWLAAAMSNWNDAERHFEAALAANRRLRTAPCTAHTEYAYGAMLLARNRRGDRPRAHYLLTQALTTAQTLGMKALEHKVAGLLPTLSAPEEDRRLPPIDHRQGDTADQTQEMNVFCREGDYWTVTFEGRVVRLRDGKGVRYLAQLLQHPGREFHVVDLLPVVTDDATAEATMPAAAPRSVIDAGMPILDATAKAEYKQRLEELRAELDEAEEFNDIGRAARLREEIAFIATQLAGAVGLGGRDRKAGSHAERARLMVTKRIKDVVQKIRAQHPALGRHLASSVKTGYFCTYVADPVRTVRWSFAPLGDGREE